VTDLTQALVDAASKAIARTVGCDPENWIPEARAAVVAVLETLKPELLEFEDGACDYADLRIPRLIDEIRAGGGS
jgi:hypothetical protein